MNIIEELGISRDYIILGMAVIIFLMIVIQLTLSIRISKQKKRVTEFMKGSDANTLEGIVKEKLNDFEKFKIDFANMSDQVNQLQETMTTVYRKSAIVKYDAFREMGGKLSFALAILNDKNNGFIINSMHSSREGCFTYVKEIIDGKSFVTLAEEEKQALEEAINSTNFLE